VSSLQILSDILSLFIINKITFYAFGVYLRFQKRHLNGQGGGWTMT
jgi:hypothetical protein